MKKDGAGGSEEDLVRDWVSLGDLTGQEAGVEIPISEDPGDHKLFIGVTCLCLIFLKGEIEHEMLTLHQTSCYKNSPFSKQLLVHCSGTKDLKRYGLFSIFVLVLESFFELDM